MSQSTTSDNYYAINSLMTSLKLPKHALPCHMTHPHLIRLLGLANYLHICYQQKLNTCHTVPFALDQEIRIFIHPYHLHFSSRAKIFNDRSND